MRDSFVPFHLSPDSSVVGNFLDLYSARLAYSIFSRTGVQPQPRCPSPISPSPSSCPCDGSSPQQGMGEWSPDFWRSVPVPLGYCPFAGELPQPSTGSPILGGYSQAPALR